MPSCYRRLALAIGPIVATALAEARGATPPKIIAPVPRITALPLNTPPINGFVPRVAFGLTSEQDNSDQTYQAHPSSTPLGTKYPSSGGPKYFVATFDTGSQSHILNFETIEAFQITSSPDRSNPNTQLIAGANGEEEVDITDGMGIYVTGLGNATSGASISVTPGTLTGQYNTALLSAQDHTGEPGYHQLPNIIGAPMMAQYQTVIRTSVPRVITENSQTYHSPDVSFQPRDTAFPSNYSRLSFDVMSPVGISPEPVFIPDLFEAFSTPANDTTTPTFWGSLIATATIAGGGNTTPERQFLFDTGAQVTVLSQELAAEAGFYSAGENPSTPDFYVPITGFGGDSLVPGFYLDQLKVNTNGGPLIWKHVPVIVLDVIDVRDGVGYLPGILGMNLFTDRDIIVNGGLNNPSVAISPQQQWSTNASGNWSDSSKWFGGVPDSIDRVANFLSKITAPQTVTVNNDYTISSLNFENANRYTLSGSGRLTLSAVDGAAGITVAGGSHTINNPMTFSGETAIWILPSASKLTITSDVIATNAIITKDGDGTLEMKNVRANTLALEGGTVSVIANGTNVATSVLKTLTATAGKMDLQNNKLIVKAAAGGGTGTLGSWNGSAYDGITGLVANDSLITTQSNATAPNSRTTLGVATAQQARGITGSSTTTFGGQTVSPTDILVMYTYAGDGNLNGLIDGDDFALIDAGYATRNNITPLLGYYNGDFNYSGKIDADDYFLIDSNYAFHGATIPSAVVAVPEPAGIAGVLTILAAVSRRRRV